MTVPPLKFVTPLEAVVPARLLAPESVRVPGPVLMKLPVVPARVLVLAKTVLPLPRMVREADPNDTVLAKVSVPVAIFGRTAEAPIDRVPPNVRSLAPSKPIGVP